MASFLICTITIVMIMIMIIIIMIIIMMSSKSSSSTKEFRPSVFIDTFPGSIYLFKVYNRNTCIIFGICSKLTIKAPEGRHWRRFGVFIVKFEQISNIILMFLFLTFSKELIHHNILQINLVFLLTNSNRCLSHRLYKTYIRLLGYINIYSSI